MRKRIDEISPFTYNGYNQTTQQISDISIEKDVTIMTNEQMKEFLKEGWKAVLPESEAADTSDFFADGGDSIKAVQLTGWLLQKGVKLDMVKVFTTPVLGEMAGTLTETQPMYVPQEMLTKEILKEKFGIDPAMVSAYPDAGKATQQTAAAPSQNPQMCTPAQNGQAGPSQNAQMCTPAQNPQMCTPAQNPQMCTPAQNPQMCTPAQNPQMCTPAQNPQMCTPAQNPQMCTPAQNPQMCTPAQNQQMCTPAQNPQMCTPAGGTGMMPMMPVMMPVFIPVMMPAMPMGFGGMPGKGFGKKLRKAMANGMGQMGNMGPLGQYNSHPVNAPVDNPNVMKINQPKVGAPDKPAEEALDIVLKGLLPTYDRSKSLFDQGFTSLNLMQIVTRCGEHGYRVQLQDIIANPTFDGILAAMKPGGEN